MAKQKKQEDEVIVDVAQSYSKAEKYVQENQKSLLVIFGGIILIVVGYVAYLQFYLEPRETNAQEEIFFAQQYFENDSLRLAVDGDGQHLGFVEIAEDYSGTKAGNLANYYAGISYLNMGQYAKAVEYLDEFDSDDPILSVIAVGAIGDAFWELNQPKDALDYYSRAVAGEENSFAVPIYLKKAGMVAEQLGQYEDALEYYNRIKKEFGSSAEAAEIDKYIAYAEAKSEE